MKRLPSQCKFCVNYTAMHQSAHAQLQLIFYVFEKYVNLEKQNKQVSGTPKQE